MYNEEANEPLYFMHSSMLAVGTTILRLRIAAAGPNRGIGLGPYDDQKQSLHAMIQYSAIMACLPRHESYQ